MEKSIGWQSKTHGWLEVEKWTAPGMSGPV
jgi:hypothetical protein